MAMLLVLVTASDLQLPLRPAVVAELARLGVSTVAILGDDRTAGLVVEGWAFDPRRSAEAVVAAIGGQTRVQTLHPLVEMAIQARRSPPRGG